MAQRRRRASSTRSGQRTHARKKPPRKPAPLLVIDQRPILKKALTKCRRLRTELHKKQERLRQFEETDQRAYQRWISATFGTRLTELRELRDEVADWEFIREQMAFCEFWMSEKLRDVHDELMRRLKDGTLHAFEPPRPDEEAMDDDIEEEDEDEAFDDIDEFFEKAFEGFFGGAEDDEDYNGEASSYAASGSAGRKAVDPEAAARKALYRTLAKRLHPDHSELEEGLRERRWNELQAAYDAADLAGLQRIEAVCDMEVGGLSLRLGLARLRDLAAYHQSHLKPVREALREAKRHPAFGFTDSKTKHMKREVEGELFDLKSQLRSHLEYLRMDVQNARDEAAPFIDDAQAEDEPDDEHDFWADYTAWRDEELRREAGEKKR